MSQLSATSGESTARHSPEIGSSFDLNSLSSQHIVMLRLADTALIHAQRISQWCGHGPALEEDLALANIGLDLLGQARLIYQHLSTLPEFNGKSEDWFAYWRSENEFFNYSIAELPNGLSVSSGPREDYAVTLAKLVVTAAYFYPLWSSLTKSPYVPLAQIAAKAVKEARYHWDHASQWVLRLGDGTQESHQRMQTALDRVWPYSNELFADDPHDLAAQARLTLLLPSQMKASWESLIGPLISQATLRRPPESQFLSTGKKGLHTEMMGFVLAEMQSLARAHPQAQW